MTRQLYTFSRHVCEIAFCFTLAACGTTPTIGPIKTVVVDLPTPVSCVPASAPIAPANTLTDASLKAMPDAAGRYQALAQFYILNAPVLTYQAGLIEACRNAAPAPK